MPLQLLADDIVIGMNGGELGVRRTVACGALQTTMPLRETIKRFARHRSVRIGGKGLVDRYTHCTSTREDTGVTNLPTILCRRTCVAGLAIRLIEPARARDSTDLSHAAVATLALHGHRPRRRIHCAAHDTTQTLCGGTRMTGVTSRTIRAVVKL